MRIVGLASPALAGFATAVGCGAMAAAMAIGGAPLADIGPGFGSGAAIGFERGAGLKEAIGVGSGEAVASATGVLAGGCFLRFSIPEATLEAASSTFSGAAPGLGAVAAGSSLLQAKTSNPHAIQIARPLAPTIL